MEWAALAGAAVSAIGQWWSNRQANASRNNRYQTAVRDMRRAGLNPALMYTGAGQPAPVMTPGNIGEAGVEGYKGVGSAKAQLAATESQIRSNTAHQGLMGAQQAKAEQETATEVQRTQQADAEAKKSKTEYNFMTDTYKNRVNQVGATIEKMAAETGYSSAAAKAEGARAENIAKDTQLKGALQELYGKQSEILDPEVKKAKGFEEMWGKDPQGFKRYLMSFLGNFAGGTAKAVGNVFSPIKFGD